MTLILDAFNVLHAWSTGPSGDLWTELSALAALSRRGPWAALPCLVVCDGPSPDRDRRQLDLLPDVAARFSGPTSDADSVIERLIIESHTPSRLVVVSSDRRIERAARRRGCRALGSPEFLRACLGAKPSTPADDVGYDEAMPPEELESWLRAFGSPSPPAPSRSPPAPPRAPRDERGLLDGAGIDPKDLDMERWLRLHPPPKPRVDRDPPSD